MLKMMSESRILGYDIVNFYRCYLALVDMVIQPYDKNA